MAKRIIGSTPKADGYRMPAEFEPQDGVWMLWPERNDNWRSGAKPAQETFCQVARAIARFEKVTMCVSAGQYQNARARLPEEIRVVEVSSNDAWVRDCGPTFLVNGQGGLRAVDWTFNAWGGLYDGQTAGWLQILHRGFSFKIGLFAQVRVVRVDAVDVPARKAPELGQ